MADGYPAGERAAGTAADPLAAATVAVTATAAKALLIARP